MHVDWSAMAPERRRLILVASDGKYEALTSALDRQKLFKEAAWVFVPWVGPLRIVFGAATASSQYLCDLNRIVAAKHTAGTKLRRVFGLMGRAGEDLVQSVTTGAIPIPHLSEEEAATRFSFDVGHPLDGCAYVLNPCSENHYLLPALANERLSQEKLAAFIDINASLGARRLEVLSASAEMSAKHARANLREAAVQVGLESCVDTAGMVARQAYMEFDAPRKLPFVEDRHRMWLKSDPLLATLANTRLTSEVRTMQATLRFDETIDVSAGACAEIAGRGINVGGEYRAVCGSTWSFAVEFWPKVH